MTPAKWLTAAKNLLFPPLCLACERKTGQEHLCSACEDKIEFLNDRGRQRAPLPPETGEDRGGQNRLKQKQPYNRIISVTAYKDPIKKLLHLFKYRNCDYLVTLFSRLMTAHLEKISFSAADYHFLVPVPLHPLKQKIRGYNQAALLAQSLANHFKKPVKDGIIYTRRFRPSQTKLKKNKREENVAVNFSVQQDLKNKQIILVDDIFTTGATISACSRALRQAGAQVITAITLSKTP